MPWAQKQQAAAEQHSDLEPDPSPALSLSRQPFKQQAKLVQLRLDASDAPAFLCKQLLHVLITSSRDTHLSSFAWPNPVLTTFPDQFSLRPSLARPNNRNCLQRQTA